MWKYGETVSSGWSLAKMASQALITKVSEVESGSHDGLLKSVHALDTCGNWCSDACHTKMVYNINHTYQYV